MEEILEEYARGVKANDIKHGDKHSIVLSRASIRCRIRSSIYVRHQLNILRENGTWRIQMKYVLPRTSMLSYVLFERNTVVRARCCYWSESERGLATWESVTSSCRRIRVRGGRSERASSRCCTLSVLLGYAPVPCSLCSRTSARPSVWRCLPGQWPQPPSMTTSFRQTLLIACFSSKQIIWYSAFQWPVTDYDRLFI